MSVIFQVEVEVLVLIRYKAVSGMGQNSVFVVCMGKEVESISFGGYRAQNLRLEVLVGTIVDVGLVIAGGYIMESENG